MRTWRVLGSLVLGMIVALPVAGYAQDSTMIGTVTDSTGGVLPGVTVTATNTESGNTFVATSDERGNFRLPVRIGNYRITTELSGFTTVSRSLQVLVGQEAVVNFQMAPATLQETVTVTGEAPLIDTTTSTVGSNIDPRQMSELPLNGRNCDGPPPAGTRGSPERDHRARAESPGLRVDQGRRPGGDDHLSLST